ncbi:D-2-hydroxyacid dehydrogenase [Halalkalicoccus jeotgali]|uniref:2-D-hydroxyacid dehydrogenase n=1 Tax=Halalkalicoccus jeotgali (strain DSM 18796 / CECT 7217 / JCM 14584 / KCTC 4019 / B3) TaxID=795797 RepID=D8J7M4_HALJB|nr:D-2-hydroxyacid dehydrogenase [Halalkalicoccus jeotgali]ADJ16044.1 2-D-hydroxyacid dehydrogenase [Halalkalicoccus jeotgali B3]ELY38140.1 2-D-hydroxyacid dehydrogenase [Halalkalicoccus jeotgali B3]
MHVERLGIHDSVSAVFPPERLCEALADLHPEVVVVDDAAAISACDAVVTFAHEEAFLDLEWIHSIQAGYDRFPLPELEDRGIVLTNSTGIHGDSVGETVLGYMLGVSRRLQQYARQQERREWDKPDWDVPFTLAGESVCVVGLGTLGRGIADRADAIGMTVTGVRRSEEPVEGVDRVYASEDLHEAISGVRFVALATPLNEHTRGLIGEAELAAMDEESYLINVARGGVVDQDALVAALEDGEIRGAALDVFETEPLPEESPLWGFEEVTVTPHVAAFTREYYEGVAGIVRTNLERIAADGTFENRVV